MTKIITPLILGVIVGAITISLVAGRSLVPERRIATTPPTATIIDRPDAVGVAESLAPQAFDSSTDPGRDPGPDPGDALRTVQRPADRRAVALGLLESTGRDLDAIERIAAALPEIDRLNFTFDAIASGAIQDPARALAQARSLDDIPSRAEAFKRIATVLGSLDPYSAIEYGLSIDNAELAGVFRSAVLEQWTNDDPEGFIGFIRELSLADARAASDAFAAAAASRPEALMRVLDELPQAVRPSAEIAALNYLVLSDIDAALAHLASLPFGEARDQLHFSTARSYALHDLEQALAWVDALEPPSPAAMTGVLLVLVKTDPVRGADHLINLVIVSGSANAVDAFSVPRVLASGPPQLMSIVADRFAGVDDAAATTMLERFIDNWSSLDPEAAHNWAMTKPQHLTMTSAQLLARNVAVANPALAQQAADRIAPELRETWIRAAAGEIARTNLDNALVWISRYEGQAVYDVALASAMQWLTDAGNLENPNALALFLDRQSDRARADSVAVVVNLWAERDPIGAARWAERVELAEADESRRGAAFANIGTRWAERDAAAAERWVLGLAEGEVRDRALGAVLAATSGTGRIDPRLIEAFSSDRPLQQSLVGTMCGLGRRDPTRGREIIDTYITEPELRARAEETLIQGLSGGVNCAGFNVIYSR